MKIVSELRDKVQRLEKELASANTHIQFLSSVTGEDPNSGGAMPTKADPTGKNAQKKDSASNGGMFDENGQQNRGKVLTQKVPDNQVPQTQGAGDTGVGGG